MVVGVFPLAKLGALLLRQISKPVANMIKERAKHNYIFRTYVCMPPAQFYNWCEVRVKMWFMNMGKPDTIPRLNEQMAIELGANLLGETIVFVSAAGVILFEYQRQVRKEEVKENSRRDEILEMQRQIRDLDFRFETQDAQIRRLTHAIAELDSKTIRLPWKGSGKPPEEFPVTKKASTPISPSSSKTLNDNNHPPLTGQSEKEAAEVTPSRKKDQNEDIPNSIKNEEKKR